MRKKNKNLIEKLILRIEIRLIEIEDTMVNQPTEIKHQMWKEYERIYDYKQELKKLLSK
jgi:hypothetical protein